MPRYPTDDPGRYLIPADQLPPGFLDRVDRPAELPVVPRPAATVALVRPGPDAVEVLLVRRPSRSGFAAGAWVFPGGVVDEADAALDLARLGAGPSGEWWAERLGLGRVPEATGFVVAAVREAWEETGILLGRGAGEPEPERERAARRALLERRTTLEELLAREGWRLDTRGLLYVAHWVTPEPESRRYDTRFFLARVPTDTLCELEGEELAEARWLTPADALARYRAGELRLLPPTVHTLARLAEHRGLDELWEAMRDAPVPRILPRMRRHPDGVMIEIE